MENYPPSPERVFIARLVTILQYATIAFALAGQQILEAVGIQVGPVFWSGLAEKRWSLILGAFFFGNTLINGIISTGAFEVLYGSDVIFSKIMTGRMPSMDELLVGVQEAMVATAR